MAAGVIVNSSAIQQPKADSKINWLLLGGLVICLVIILVLTVILIRLKRRIELSNTVSTILPAEYRMLGNFAAEKGKLPLAGKCYRKAAELEPYDKNTYYELGVSLFKAERYQEAITEFNKYVKGEIVRSEAYFYLAYSYLHLGNLDKSEEYFQKVLQLKPNDVYTYVGLGVIAQSRQQSDQARQYYEKALALNPNCHEAQENLQQLE